MVSAEGFAVGRFQRALFLPSPPAAIPAVAAKPAEQSQADGLPGDRLLLDPHGSSFDRRRHPSVIDAPARPDEDPTTIGSERQSAGSKP